MWYEMRLKRHVGACQQEFFHSLGTTGSQQMVLRRRVTGSDLNFGIALTTVWSLNGMVGGRMDVRTPAKYVCKMVEAREEGKATLAECWWLAGVEVERSGWIQELL